MHDNDHSGSGVNSGKNMNRIDSSPDDFRANNAISLSSPSIKSESDINSPPQPSTHSPISQTGGHQAHNQMLFKSTNGIGGRVRGGGELGNGLGAYSNHEEYGNMPTNEDDAWLYDDDVDAADLPIVLRAMVSISNSPNNGLVSGGGGATSSISTSNMRQRFRYRLQAKGINLNSPTLSNIPEMNRNIGIGIGELNQRITDLKMEPGSTKINNDTKHSPPCSTNLTELQTRLCSNSNTMISNFGLHSNLNPNLRRDSQNSNASTYYCSMQSRRSSQSSQLSSISTMRPCSYNAGSLYDPISPGCSRRSSQMSNITTGGQNSVSLAANDGGSRRVSVGVGCDFNDTLNSTNNQSLPPTPSSHLISTHLQRLQNSTSSSAFFKHPHESGRYSIPSPLAASYIAANRTTDGSNNTNSNIIPGRRLSEPLQQSYERPLPSPPSLTNTLQTVALANSKKEQKTSSNSGPELVETKTKEPIETSLDHHPNEKVNLDEVEEDELIENKLVLPDEMLQYLNQVADRPSNQESTSHKKPAHKVTCPPLFSPNLYPNSPESPSTINQVMSPQSGHTMSALGSPYSQRNYDQRSQGDNQCRQYPIYYDYCQKRVENANPQFMNSTNHYQCCFNQHLQPTLCQQKQQPPPKTTHELNTNFTQNITAPADSSMTSLPEIKSNETKCNYFANTLVSQIQLPSTTSKSAQQSTANALKNEIQCQDITQSQMSPALAKPSPPSCAKTSTIFPKNANNQRTFTPQCMATTPVCYGNGNNNNALSNSSGSMCTDAYQRTLEYVQNCQSWLQTKSSPNHSSQVGEFVVPQIPAENRTQTGYHHQADVTSSTHPSSNMVINDMTTSLSSLLEENRYLQMIQ